jgi:hypothetical protein
MSSDKSFGLRHGFESLAGGVQLDDMNHALRTDLYNSFLLFVYEVGEENETRSGDYRKQHRTIWLEYLRLPLDKFPKYSEEFKDNIRYRLFNCHWYQVYEFFEFLFQSLDVELYRHLFFRSHVNRMLERNNSGYRLIGHKFTPISNSEEIKEVEQAKQNGLEDYLDPRGIRAQFVGVFKLKQGSFL